jgi:thioredoxin 2
VKEIRMDSSFTVVQCRWCGAKNKIPRTRIKEKAFCGKCHKPIVVSSHLTEPIDVTDMNFRQEVLEYSGTVLVVFWVPWCGACRMVLPLLDNLAGKYAGRIKIAKVNVDSNPVTSSRYGINSTPTLHFFKNGTLVKSLIGAVPQEELEENMKYVLS